MKRGKDERKKKEVREAMEIRSWQTAWDRRSNNWGMEKRDLLVTFRKREIAKEKKCNKC
jgi:hypothetical protein